MSRETDGVLVAVKGSLDRILDALVQDRVMSEQQAVNIYNKMHEWGPEFVNVLARTHGNQQIYTEDMETALYDFWANPAAAPQNQSMFARQRQRQQPVSTMPGGGRATNSRRQVFGGAARTQPTLRRASREQHSYEDEERANTREIPVKEVIETKFIPRGNNPSWIDDDNQISATPLTIDEYAIQMLRYPVEGINPTITLIAINNVDNSLGDMVKLNDLCKRLVSPTEDTITSINTQKCVAITANPTIANLDAAVEVVKTRLDSVKQTPYEKLTVVLAILESQYPSCISKLFANIAIEMFNYALAGKSLQTEDNLKRMIQIDNVEEIEIFNPNTSDTTVRDWINSSGYSTQFDRIINSILRAIGSVEVCDSYNDAVYAAAGLTGQVGVKWSCKLSNGSTPTLELAKEFYDSMKVVSYKTSWLTLSVDTTCQELFSNLDALQVGESVYTDELGGSLEHLLIRFVQKQPLGVPIYDLDTNELKYIVGQSLDRQLVLTKQ